MSEIFCKSGCASLDFFYYFLAAKKLTFLGGQEGGGGELQNWLASDHPGVYASMPHPFFVAKDVSYIVIVY